MENTDANHDSSSTSSKEEATVKDSNFIESHVHTINFGETFGVFNYVGDSYGQSHDAQGIFFEDTRFLARCELRIAGQSPLLLSSTVKERNHILSVDLMNPTIKSKDGTSIEKGTVHIQRSKFMRHAACYEDISIRNFSREALEFDLSYFFAADFRDIFEIRGMTREKRGELLGVEHAHNDELVLSYRGLDQILRRLKLKFSPAPGAFSDHEVRYSIKLAPKGTQVIHIIMSMEGHSPVVETGPLVVECEGIGKELIELAEKISQVDTSNEQFNHWLNRSRFDLVSLIGETPFGRYPHAGLPWYNVPFGRDGLITALQTLWVAPKISRDVLLYLAKTQATELNEKIDAEPGKIFHETRKGEMSQTGEVPFKLYYGTVDATPLFVTLAGKYFRHTGDRELIQQIWPSIQAAIEWIDTYGDMDGDGFVEYAHKAENGLTNQGWKDSFDSISYEDGRLAEPPIALCEVQSYVYEAKISAALMAKELGHESEAEKLKTAAYELKVKFNRDFWDEERKTYVLALDGDKQPCRVRSSNVGHCLFSGIVDRKRAKDVIQGLLAPHMYSGWGIRTLSEYETLYNPMSYHNGSVWPHDNSVCAMGMGRYGYRAEALTLMQAMFEASMFYDLPRLPELFCGFHRRAGEGPTDYPVACSPQAWAVGSVFGFLQSVIGIDVDALNQTVTFYDPKLPPYLDHIKISQLDLGGKSMDFMLIRYSDDVCLRLINKPRSWQVLVKKV
ncbi:MAG: glycogen debranching N-terminal domain-containing protein [Oligoflexus sp.]